MRLFELILLSITIPTTVLCVSQGTPINDLKDSPYQVSIRLKSKDGSFGAGYICSGVLIDHLNVLTSAQCLHDSSTKKLLTPNSLTLVLGTIYRTKAPSQHISRNVKKIYLNEGVNVTERYNDIAVLRLDEAIPKDKIHIKEIELRNDVVKGSTVCRVTGWGSTTSIEGEFSDVLHSTQLTIMGPQNCNASASIIGRPLDPDHICAVARGTGPCRGDLGAPLVCEKSNLTGIVTLETGCGASGRHPIFTSVFSHKNWIETVLKMDNSAVIETPYFFCIFLIATLNLFK